MRPPDIPRVRTWEEFTALGLEACDLVLVEGIINVPIPAYLAERLLPPPSAPPRWVEPTGAAPVSFQSRVGAHVLEPRVGVRACRGAS